MEKQSPPIDGPNPYEPPRAECAVPPDEAGGSLYRDRSFWGLVATQFLGAFNDNVFKQLMLLLAVPVAAGTSGGIDQQGLATALFSLPFVLFSGYAGWLSDRFSKPTIITFCKVAEIAIAGLALIGFWSYAQTGYSGMLLVLFLMGAHSAFFGPGKYGILPELFHERDLPRANGLILMTTFLAIIFGTALAGGMGDLLMGAEKNPQNLWIGSLVCIGIACCGTITSLLIRPLPPAEPKLPLHWDTVVIPHATRHLLATDRPLLTSLIVSCLFWLVGGVTMQAVNSLGLVQLELNKTNTSLLTATIGLGIMLGAPLAGKLCRGKGDSRIVIAGGWGIVAALVAMSITLPGGKHLLGFGGSAPTLIVLGASSALFAIPVQVFLQTRPPAGQKGRMIAAMNLCNFIAIMLSGGIYFAFDRLVTYAAQPRSLIFLCVAALLLPVLLVKLPWEDPPAGNASDSPSRP